MWGFGVRPGDTVFIGSYFSLYLGSWGALAGGELLGARPLPFGAGAPGQTERALELIDARAADGLLRDAVICAAPGPGRAGVRGFESAGLGFRVMFFSGEPGAGIPSTKHRIEELFGAACIDTGSMAEMTPWMTNAECAERTGMHLWEDIVYTEIVDPADGRPLEGDGEGVPVYTHLERTSQPMIRLYSGDVTYVTSEPCPCGRTYRRLPRGVYGRVDDMLIVRGVNVYPSAIEDALAHVSGVGSEYRIVLERPEELDVLIFGSKQRTPARRTSYAIPSSGPPGSRRSSGPRARPPCRRRSSSRAASSTGGTARPKQSRSSWFRDQGGSDDHRCTGRSSQERAGNRFSSISRSRSRTACPPTRSSLLRRAALRHARGVGRPASASPATR